MMTSFIKNTPDHIFVRNAVRVCYSIKEFHSYMRPKQNATSVVSGVNGIGNISIKESSLAKKSMSFHTSNLKSHLRHNLPEF